MRYIIYTNFNDERFSSSDARRYFEVIKRYNAFAMKHEKTNTSTIFISSDKPVNLEKIAQELGNISILSIEKAA